MRRNIADAIYGTLIQTADDRKAGRNPTTMADKLADLVASGKLVEVKPSPVLGEHTDEVLADLGYSKEQIAGLHAAKAV